MSGNRMTWQNPKILSILLLVFLSGALAGAVSVRYGYVAYAKRGLSYWREGGREISLERFRRELNLNPDQTRQVETVLNDFVNYYQMLQEQMNEVRSSGKSRILQILDDNQKKKFERMLSDLQAKQIK